MPSRPLPPPVIWITPRFGVTTALAAGDFAALAASGVRSVVCNRPDGEEAGQIDARDAARLAARSGLAFRHVPAGKHELFTADVVDGMAAALAALEGPIVAHCKSGLRSAIVWAAATARGEAVDDILGQLAAAGFDLDFIRDDLDAQADRKHWLAR